MKNAESTIKELLKAVRGLPPSKVKTVLREVECRATALEEPRLPRALPAVTSGPEHLMCTLHVSAFEFVGNRPVEKNASLRATTDQPSVLLSPDLEAEGRMIRLAEQPMAEEAQPAAPAPASQNPPPSLVSSSVLEFKTRRLPWPTVLGGLLLLVWIPLASWVYSKHFAEHRPVPVAAVRETPAPKPSVLAPVQVASKPAAATRPVAKRRAPSPAPSVSLPPIVPRNPLEERQ